MSPADPAQSPGAGAGDNARPPASGSGRPGAGTRPGGDPDPVLVLHRRLDRIDRTQEKHAQRLADLADLVARTAGGAGAGGDGEDDKWLPSWLLVEDPGEATARLVELAGWLDTVYLRYGDAELPACWAWHPDAVEELLILRELWFAAWRGKGRSWVAAADWHHKHRTGVRDRLQRLTACSLAEHRPGRAAGGPAPTAAMRSALDVIAGMWSVSRELPHPTDEQVQQARRHDLRHTDASGLTPRDAT